MIGRGIYPIHVHTHEDRLSYGEISDLLEVVWAHFKRRATVQSDCADPECFVIWWVNHGPRYSVEFNTRVTRTEIDACDGPEAICDLLRSRFQKAEAAEGNMHDSVAFARSSVVQ